MDVSRYLELMRHDKKVVDGKMRLVLIEQLGRAVLSHVATPSDIARAIAARSFNA